MSDVNISPNMNLPVPIVSQDPGPDWANNINACMGQIDSHDHSTNEGVPITPGGLNINSDLTINDNNLTNARTVRFESQSAVLSDSADLGCLYEVSADLYYNDGAGNQIRITQSGSVAGSTGTITGLPSGTASASYSAGTFTFQSATNTPATISVGPVALGQANATSKNVTISCSNSQATNYNMVLPVALPASVQSTMVSDTSGNLTFLQLLASTYSPTVTSGGSGSLQAAQGAFFYTRVGNIVSVQGTLIGTGSGAGDCTWLVTLPFNPSSTFSHDYDVAGVMGRFLYGGHTTATATVIANTGTNQVLASFNGGTGIGSVTPTISFTYSCA